MAMVTMMITENFAVIQEIKCLGGLVQIKKPINFKRSAFGITGYAVVKAFRPLTI